MSTDHHSVPEELTAGPRPHVNIKRLDREHVRKHIEQRAKATTVEGAAGESPTKLAEKRQAARPDSGSIKPTFEQAPISDTTHFPYSAIGVVTIKFGTRTASCTGALVGSNAVLTVASVLTIDEWNGWTQGQGTVQFTPGFNQGATPFGVINVTNIWGWPPSGNPADDYMILRLETPVGNETQWFNVWASNDPADYASGAHGFYRFSVGYPNASAQIQSVGFLFGAVDIANNGGSMVVHTDSFAEGSWAGGPVWTTNFASIGESPAPPDMIAVATTFPESGGQQAIVGGTDMKGLVIFAQDHWL